MKHLSTQKGKGIRPPGPDPKVKTVHWLQYMSLRFFGLLVGIMPAFCGRALGRALGALAYRLMNRHRDIALRNVEQAFGTHKNDAEKQAIVKNCFLHFGQAAMEILRIPKITERNFLRYVQWENVGQFYKGLQEKKGVILCSAHYGNWEIMNLALGYLNLPMSVMARPMDNPLIHRYVERIRTQSGNRVIYKHNSVRKLLKTLKENRIVGIVNDQNVHSRNRIMVELFGKDAATTPVPAALCVKTGAPIVPGFAVPLGKGRYLLRFEDLIRADPSADKDAEIKRITRLLNQRLETQIHFKPAYWMWLHKRFKTGAEGLTDFYDPKRSVG